MTVREKLFNKLKLGGRLCCSECRKVLQELGFELKRQKGSHEQWVKGGKCFTLACHGKDAAFYIADMLKELIEEKK